MYYHIENLDHEVQEFRYGQFMLNISYTIQFLGTGIYLVILLQVFNWFPTRSIHWIMALWTMSQGFGAVTNITIEEKDNYKKLFPLSAVFILLAVVDYHFFRMHPA